MKDNNKIILMSVLAGIALVLMLWTGILIHDTKTRMEETHNTLDIIEDTLAVQGILLDKIDDQLHEICLIGKLKIECP